MTRIVVKVGSSSLTTSDGHLDAERIGPLVDAIVAARAAGNEVVLVSSGAIAAGLGPLGLPARPRDLSTQQAAASVGQGALIEFYARRFAEHGVRVGQVLLTIDDVSRRSHYRNAHQTFATLLEMSVVPIVNENDTVATSEIRFGDNDRLAALVAHLVRADLLVLLSDVDALYTGHPSLPDSRRVAVVRNEQDLAGVDVSRVGSAVGTGGMVTKVEAARIATAAGIPTLLTGAGLVEQALNAGKVGTRFEATGKRRPARLLWLAHASNTKGSLVLDDGAVRAITVGKASLLAAGILGIEGVFSAADPVDLVDVEGRVVARGLVNFDSAELPTMVGRSSAELAMSLGPEYEREVVHRDDLVVL